MRAVLQRVKQASVRSNGQLLGEIEKGWLVLVAVSHGDTEKDIKYIVEKTIHLRLFPDEQGKFNRSVLDVNGGLLIVSQFTLMGDCRKGRRPSFSASAPPEEAVIQYLSCPRG